MPIRPIDRTKADRPIVTPSLEPSPPRRRIVARARSRSPEGEGTDQSGTCTMAPAFDAPVPNEITIPAKRSRRDHSGSNWNEDGSYKVGKGKPPTSHQFRKGVSGNPKGRPKGARSVNSIAADIFDVKVPVKVGGETKMMNATGVVLTKLYEQAVKGKLAAIAQILAIQRERHPEQPASEALLISAEEATLIDDILSKAGFGASPVARAGQAEELGREDDEDEWDDDGEYEEEE